jgi:hypothetical protein
MEHHCLQLKLPLPLAVPVTLLTQPSLQQEMATVDEQFVDQTLIDIKVAEQQKHASRVPDLFVQEQVISRFEARARERKNRSDEGAGEV